MNIFNSQVQTTLKDALFNLSELMNQIIEKYSHEIFQKELLKESILMEEKTLLIDVSTI